MLLRGSGFHFQALDQGSDRKIVGCIDADSAALISKATGGSGITITNAAGGLAEIAIAPTDFASLDNEPTRYVWGLTEKDASSNVWRLDRGTLLVAAAVQETIP